MYSLCGLFAHFSSYRPSPSPSTLARSLVSDSQARLPSHLVSRRFSSPSPSTSSLSAAIVSNNAMRVSPVYRRSWQTYQYMAATLISGEYISTVIHVYCISYDSLRTLADPSKPSMSSHLSNTLHGTRIYDCLPCALPHHFVFFGLQTRHDINHSVTSQASVDRICFSLDRALVYNLALTSQRCLTWVYNFSPFAKLPGPRLYYLGMKPTSSATSSPMRSYNASTSSELRKYDLCDFRFVHRRCQRTENC